MSETISCIEGFSEQCVDAGGASIFVRTAGIGPPVLLLHGFPQTGLMWRHVAPRLVSSFTTIVADLPGYGRSDRPLEGMSKRAMASLLVRAMARLGHDRFAIFGHDRGGRVAYRAAIDHPQHVTALAVLDVIPTAEVWARADDKTMLTFWPFILLAQPAPLPERLISAAPESIVDNALECWGSPGSIFPDEIRAAYVDALRDPKRVHDICDEYRAAATVDREHDEEDRAARRRIEQPLLALWSASGGLSTWYEDEGGPLGIWRCWANDVRGRAIVGGHFFPEENPHLTADLLRPFSELAGQGR